MRKVSAIFTMLAALILLTTISISADVLQYHNVFNAELGPDGGLLAGGGDGYNNGEWFYYPESEWTTQWFYNGPFNPDRWKRVWGSIAIDPTDPSYYVEFAINWATPEWDPTEPTGGSAPPLPGDIIGIPEDALIEYEILFSFDEQNPAPGSPVNFYFEILEYNPEWISIDVSGYNFAIAGEIWHECVPEPATMLLLAIGGMGVLLRRKQ